MLKLDKTVLPLAEQARDLEVRLDARSDVCFTDEIRYWSSRSKRPARKQWMRMFGGEPA